MDYVADITNPETGKTYREENNELKHSIPLKTLVEVDFDDSYTEDKCSGLRLFVARHDRDCDGTPLYSLSFHYNWDINMYGEQLQKYAKNGLSGGYSERCLKIIKLP